MTLRQISFRNFKRFERFSIVCGPANVLVGPNNAGKSTALDALRILYGAIRYARRLTPKLISIHGGDAWGYEIPDSSIPIGLASVVRDLDVDTASIDFTHENGRKLTVEVHPERQTRLYIHDVKRTVTSGKYYFSFFPIDIVIVPTLAPFEQEESYVIDQTVDRHRASRLSSRHFRNIWKRSTDEEFSAFRDLLEGTWPGISIRRPTLLVGGSLEMFYTENRRPREIAWAGFGFQVWLQILTHMLRGEPGSIFVLDEPDVYLHPDLQRRLLSIVREKFPQFFLATHSTELINFCDTGDIVSVNPTLRTARRVRSDAEYNDVFAYIGSLENVEISKISRSKKIIFFEGKDKKLLARFCKKANLAPDLSNGEALVVGVGGFGQWRRVLAAAWTFKEVLQIEVSTFAIFDKDYRDRRELDEILSEFSDKTVRCSIWNRKELENYLLDSAAIYEAACKRLLKSGRTVPTREYVDDLLDEASRSYKHDVQAQSLSNTISYERRINSGLDVATIASRHSKSFDERWDNLHERLKLVPGKQVLADLSTLLQDRLGCSISANAIVDEMRLADIDEEMMEALKAMDEFYRG